MNHARLTSDARNRRNGCHQRTPSMDLRRSVMNAVEYCLLHGLKLAGAAHPALLSAGEVLSYGALERRVSQFAAGLRELGVGTSDRVGMLMLDTPVLVAMHLAAMAAGGIAVAVSSRAGPEELEQILAIVRPAVLVIDAEFEEFVAAAIAAVSSRTKLIRRDREFAVFGNRKAAPLVPAQRKPNDPAFWVMTSGTTGVPKAVEHHHPTSASAPTLTSRCSAARARTGPSRPRGSTSPMRSATCSRACGWGRATSSWSAGRLRRASPKRWNG